MNAPPPCSQRCVALCTIVSILLGYDIGVWGAAKRAVRERFDLNDVEVEVLIGMLNIVAAVGGILSGKLSDKYGRSVRGGPVFRHVWTVCWFNDSLNAKRKRQTQRVHVLTRIDLDVTPLLLLKRVLRGQAQGNPDGLRRIHCWIVFQMRSNVVRFLARRACVDRPVMIHTCTSVHLPACAPGQ